MGSRRPCRGRGRGGSIRRGAAGLPSGGRANRGRLNGGRAVSSTAECRLLLWIWTVAVLLLSPVVHFWYVLWLLPVAVLMRHPAWWVWSLTVFLAYAPLPEFRAGGVWTESTALKAVEYLPVLLLVPLQIWWGRRSAIVSP
jgi:hypothetical protein